MSEGPDNAEESGPGEIRQVAFLDPAGTLLKWLPKQIHNGKFSFSERGGEGDELPAKSTAIVPELTREDPNSVQSKK